MSQAPRHSNPRTLNSAPVRRPAASSIAVSRASAPHSEHEMFVQTYTLWRPTGSVSSMS